MFNQKEYEKIYSKLYNGEYCDEQERTDLYRKLTWLRLGRESFMGGY